MKGLGTKIETLYQCSERIVDEGDYASWELVDADYFDDVNYVEDVDVIEVMMALRPAVDC